MEGADPGSFAAEQLQKSKVGKPLLSAVLISQNTVGHGDKKSTHCQETGLLG